MSESFGDGEALTYPEADRIVAEYVHAKAAQRRRTTSRHVCQWAEAQTTSANQRRVHDALTRACERLDADWAGRTVFELPSEGEL